MAHDETRPQFQQSSPIGPWDHIYPHSHHGTPAQEYSGFSFTNPQTSMESGAYSSNMQQRPYAQLQPLIMPQWPSMLSTHQAHQQNYQPVYPPSIQPMTPMSAGPVQTPVSTLSSRSTSAPRKTLTDQDRRRMCQYAEEHPHSKQTEIGAIFGVERSTVSKVLRQKEKYLFQEDGNRSPIKRTKGRTPDIERALANWARNQEKKGLPLSDEVIRDKARAFAATTTTPENHQLLSSSWIEKFKLKHNLSGARSRKNSLAPDDCCETASQAASTSHTPGGISPVSPDGPGSPSPEDMHQSQYHDTSKFESHGSLFEYASRNGPLHSQSATALNGAFADAVPSSFSPGTLSPTSPLFTPDSGTAPAAFANESHAQMSAILPATPTQSNSQRPRSQTFPLLDQYMAAASASSDGMTPKYVTAMLDSPMEEASDPLDDMDEAVKSSMHEDRPNTVTPSETMRPPPLPAHLLAAESKRELTPSTSSSSLRQAAPSPEEALSALQLVHSFFEQQPNGFLDFQESVTMGKLMEKLKLQSQSRSNSICG
ncbi:hypothetical protein Tdes44962_MAKER08016 [Teratosphaeria destructans]|uniref:HTH CENPB-type domain-containing protein n=1 Tax=Teratosphaeria destructans TaxID=418781 RepID=A0A9W7SXD1_9PEZI|nr:hypothetical protein Tdes44962_MAKER08016 [Teratosphaeria destructans]